MTWGPTSGESWRDDADRADRVTAPSTLLITQPSTTERGRDACIDALTAHPPTLANLVVIAHEQSPDEWLATWRRRIGEPPANLTCITTDATTRAAAQPISPPQGTTVGNQEVLALSDPGDLTQLGIAVSERLTDWQDTDHRPVVCGGSLTALLQWVELPVLFRFLHVFLQRLRAADALVHFHLHPPAHPDETKRTLAPLFDRVIDEPLNRTRSDQLPARHADPDTLRELLGVPRRRHVLRILLDEGSMAVGTLAERVVARESTALPADHDALTHDRMRINLHHTQLPKLDTAGLIDYDEVDHTVQLATSDHHVKAYLDRLDAQS